MGCAKRKKLCSLGNRGANFENSGSASPHDTEHFWSLDWAQYWGWKTTTVAQGMDLQARDLQGRDLQGRDLQDRDLQGKDLQGRDLQRRGLQGRVMQGRDLQVCTVVVVLALVRSFRS